MTIHVINGPNLNLLGRREPEIYGTRTFEDFWVELLERFPDLDLFYFQSNHEGELLDYIQEIGFEAETALVINAGALSHTSFALGDCLGAITAPVVEVHISNIHAREAFRQHTYVGPQAVGLITGLGLEGYALAIQFLASR